jgi:hypothetical protein
MKVKRQNTPEGIKDLASLDAEEGLGEEARSSIGGSTPKRLSHVSEIAEVLVNDVDFSCVSGNVHREVERAADKILEQVEILQERPNSRTNVTQPIDDFYKSSATILANSQATSGAPLLREVQELQGQAEEKVSEIENILNDAESLEERLKESAQTGAVAERARYFKDQADQHSKWSNLWLITTVVLAIVVLGYAGYLSSHYLSLIGATQPQDQSTWVTVQLAISRIAIFSVLFFGVITTSRLYRSEQHNYVINQHRYNSLQTFEVFVESANDQEVQRAVLLQTTESIFSPQKTGFQSKSGEGSPSPAGQVTDLLQGVSK